MEHSKGQQPHDESKKQEPDAGGEWDSDLETEGTTNEKANSSSAELYHEACLQAQTLPASSFLSHMGEADLNLNHCRVGPSGAKALATVLQHYSDVINLELEDNLLQAEGARYLMKTLRTNVALQSLNLSNNQLQLEGAQVISEMLLNNQNIKSIKLSGNGFDDRAAKYISEALEGDFLVKELDLSHNRLCEGTHLGYMLAKTLGLEVLNLSWNHIRMCGALALTDGLKVNSTLRQLQLSWNGFGRREAESLGEALKLNSTLVLLDLSGNRLDDQAVALLCRGLDTNEALKILKLSHNLVTHTGALTLLRTVQNNRLSAMEEVDISTVFVCETFMEILEEAHQRSPALVVRYSVMRSVIRNVSALHSFQKSLKERHETIMDFFQALDEEGTMLVSTSAFRKAVKAACIPVDQRQLDWLTRRFDKDCTATINYSHFAQLL